MEEPIFDVQRACDELKISVSIYMRIVSRAIDQTQGDLKSLKDAYAQNDIVAVQSIAHRLKGDYANLRIDMLSVIARELNDLAKQNCDRERVGVLIDDFEKKFQQVAVFIEQENKTQDE